MVGKLMATKYKDYYKAKLEAGLVFQDFVVDLCWQTIGLAIVQYTSHAYQIAVGESRTGAEIKFDMKFATTRNLWIEIAEKAQPREGCYFESGIERSNGWLYIIGDYDTVFIFPRNILVAMSQSGKYPMRENNTKTSLGFLLQEKRAERYAAVILRPNAQEKVAKLCQDLWKTGNELHAAVKSNPAQMSLLMDELDAHLVDD